MQHTTVLINKQFTVWWALRFVYYLQPDHTNFVKLQFCIIYLPMCRDAPRVKNPGGQVVMRRAAAPSDLPKSGGAAAPPAPPLGASLYKLWPA